MAFFREYLLSVTAAAIICAVIPRLIPKSKPRELVKLLGGLLLTLTILRPIAQVDLSIVSEFEIPFAADASYYRSMGEKEAETALAECITEKTEAYILAEAERLQAQIHVTVMLDEENLPCEVILDGNASPSARERLEAFLESNLAITKEHQIWTG